MRRRSWRLIWAWFVFVATLAAALPLASAYAPDEVRPNVLMIVTDDQRAHGTMDVLPAVREWIGERGTTYTNAFATTPLCCPSRASILTGMYPHNHEVRQNGREARRKLDFQSTLPAYLDEVGYRTGIVGKFFNKWPKEEPPPYFDSWAVSGSRYRKARFDIHGRERTIGRYATEFVTERAVDFVKQGHDSAPWFLYVAPLAAHAPFRPAVRYREGVLPPYEPDPSVGERDRSDKPSWVQRHAFPSEKVIERRRAGQLRSLMSVNDLVKQVMGTLRETDQLSNTLVVFMSDNGFLWGEHSLGNKRFPYLPSTRIPLVVSWPGRITEGATDSRLVANIDIAPTILEAAGIQPDETLDGISLSRRQRRGSLFLEFASDFERPLPSWGSVLTDGVQYIEYYGRSGRRLFTEYYDLSADPAQLVNLLNDGNRLNDPPSPVLRRLRHLVETGRECRGASCHRVPPGPVG